MTIDNLLKSIRDCYLHFNRVDNYKDFPGADLHDGEQLPKDRQNNAKTKFEKKPSFTAECYYDQSRHRSYACCFSLENSNFIWENYAKDSEKGNVCVVFNFDKLRFMLNHVLQSGHSIIQYGQKRCKQIFYINYGIVEYIELETFQANMRKLPNPIEYIYLKSKEFSEEKEFRISLSALGIGNFVMDDTSIVKFPGSLQMTFDFRTAFKNGVIPQILYSSNSDSNFLYTELDSLGILPTEGSDLSLRLEQ